VGKRIRYPIVVIFAIFVQPMRCCTIILLILIFQLIGCASANCIAEKPNSTLSIMASQRIHVFFTGKVQGVGFRQSVHDYAVQLGLKGWVKNLEDQRVEMVAEGNEADLNLLLGKICSEFEVKKAEVKKEKFSGTLKGFEIVR
jgi:acylphosphatase